jgi:hypothetical protein
MFAIGGSAIIAPSQPWLLVLCHAVIIDEHTTRESLMKSQPQSSSPTCVSKVIWEQDQMKIFPVNDNFPVRCVRELVHDKKRPVTGRSQPHNFSDHNQG